MSPLTYWLAIVALVIVALYVVNAVAYRLRFGTFLRAEERPAILKWSLSKVEAVMVLLPALALLVCVTAPTIAPTSSFTHWLLEPYSRTVFVVWCFLLSVIAGSMPAVYALYAKRAR